MEYIEIGQDDYEAFHSLACAYYREGEDSDTPQDEIDRFISYMFEMVTSHTIEGFFAKSGNDCIGFALWAVDSEYFEFSEMPGLGTIMEIGLISSCRNRGFGRKLVRHIEKILLGKGIKQCYVCAYGPAQKFWTHCGYVENWMTASNELPIMVKDIG